MLVPDAELLFTAQFYRHGPDLLLVGHDGRHLLITGYFSSEHHPALVAPSGARLTADTVDLLAGSPTPGHYAQASPTAPPEAIGKVEKAVGDVGAIRNGAAIVLHVGDAVFKSDVIATGAASSCGISFPDGTALNLVANTRMAMNDYTFDASANSGNGALFTLVEGTFAFVAGKVAHTGDMKISTPVATMGIRGTTGVVQEVATITANVAGQTYSFAVVPDFGTGVTGVYDLYDANGNVIATVSQNGYVTFVTPQNLGQPIVHTEVINNAQVQFEQQLLADLFRTLNPLNLTNPGSTNGSSTPPPQQPFNPIPQLLLQPPGTPINYTIPGTNGGPSTPIVWTITLAQTGPTTTVFWVGGSGNWDNASNWSDQIVPTMFSVVEILNPVTVTVSDAHTANGLVLGAGANLDIVSGGSLEVANSIQGAGTVTLDSSGGDPTLAIDGNVTLSGGGTIALTGTAADNHIVGVPGSNAFLINVNDTIVGTGTIGDGSGDLHFQNFATVNATGLLIVDTGNQVANNGMMEATAGGTLWVKDSAFNAGTIQATGSGATVELSGPVTNDFVITVTDGGLLQLESITVTNAGGEVTVDALSSFDLDNASVIGGVIDNAGTAVVTGLSVLHGDTVTNEGTITVGSGASLTLQGDTELINNITGAITADGGTVIINLVVDQNINSGQIIAVNGGTVDFEIDIDGGSNHGLISAGVGGTVNFYNNHSDGGGGGGGDSSNQGGNHGTMQASGAGAVMTFNGGLDNFDRIQAGDGGTVNLTAGLDNHAGGIVQAGGGGTINITNDNITDQTWNAGLIDALHGGTININDTDDVDLGNTGTIEADGGTIVITHDDVSIDSTGTLEAIHGGTITVDSFDSPGSGPHSGNADADGGTITYNGGVGTAGGATLQAINCGAVIVNAGNGAANAGINNVAGGTMQALSGGSFDITITNPGTATNPDNVANGIANAGTMLADHAAFTINIDDTGDNVTSGISNSGTIKADHGGTFTIDYDFTGDDDQGGIGNTGTIEAVHGGTLTIDVDISGDNGGFGISNGNMLVADRGTITITADITGTDDNGAGFTNTGTVQATDCGTVTFDSFGVNNFGGYIEATKGGSVVFDDAFVRNDNLGLGVIGTITADGAGSTVRLSNHTTIGGGVLGSTNGGVIENVSGTSTLNGVTITDGSVLQTDAHSELNIVSADLVGTVTFEGAGVFVLDIGLIDAVGIPATLVNLGTITGDGEIGNADMTVDNLSNDKGYGTISADVCGQTLSLATGDNQIVNSGTLAGTDGGTLAVGSSLDTSGEVDASHHGSVQIEADVHNSGTGQIEAQSCGTVTFDSVCVTNSSDATIDADSHGTIAFDCSHLVNCGSVSADCGGTITFSYGSVDNYGEVTGDVSNGIAADGGAINFDGDHVDNAGVIQANTFGAVTFDNACVDNSGGVIDDGNGIVALDGGTVTFCDSTVTNTGVIRAIVPDSDHSSGGTIQIDNTFVDNTGTFSVVGSGSSIELSDSTIKGGTLAAGEGGTGGVLEVVAAGGDNTSVLQGGNVVLNSQISVPGQSDSDDSFWNETGISVTAGEQITIAATGAIVIGTTTITIDGHDVTVESPAGYPGLTTAGITHEDGGTFLAPGLVPYSLVGQIDGGTPFEVGLGTTFTATSSGELFLAINDNNFGDNSGSWSASVTATQPALTNTGLVQVEAGAQLELQGAIDNDGQIDVDGPPGDTQTHLEIGGIVALGGSGTGTVTLDGSSDYIIGTGDGGGRLDNVNNTISGAGHIGDGGSLTLINDIGGIIDADTSCATLAVDTGHNTIVNAGVMEATGGGRLEIDSAVCNTGALTADGAGSVLDIAGSASVSGGGAVFIQDGGTAIFRGAVDQQVIFIGSGTDTLQLDCPANFCGTIAGMSETRGVVDLKGFSADGTTATVGCYNGDTGITTLTVVDDGKQSVTLKLVGDYVGDTFDATSDHHGGVDVTEVPTAPPGTDGADNYVWVGPVAGSWDAASNWNDTTAGQNPASVAPGSNDNVTINSTGGVVQVITGVGDAASLTINGETALSGDFSVGTLTVNRGDPLQVNDTLTVSGDASISASLSVGGSLLVTGNVTDPNAGSLLQIHGGTFTVQGTFTSNFDSVQVHNGGSAQLDGLVATGATIDLFVDTTSSLEIGSAGGAAAGSLTIDAGVATTVAGSFNAVSIVDNGTIDVGGHLTLNGALDGSGAINIGSGSTLTVENFSGATASSTGSITFEGSDDALMLNGNALNGSDVFVPTLSGFNASDVIDYEGTVTNAIYNSGVLTLFDGATAVAYLTIGSGYDGDTFYAVSVSSSVTQVVVLGTGDTASAPPGTDGTDNYVWVGPVAGSWDVALNWDDTTAGQDPASVAPGSNDSVTINSAGGGVVQVITGSGDAASLTINGVTALSGNFSVGTLTVNHGDMLQVNDTLTVSGNASISAELSVGGTLTVGSLTMADNPLSVSSGGSLLVTGNVTDPSAGSLLQINGGTFTVQGTFTSNFDSVQVHNGGSAQLDGLVATGATIDLFVDTTSSLEIGSAGGAAAGSLTIDAGVTTTVAGSFNAVSIVDNGTIDVGGHLLLNGALDGSGAINIGSGGTLTVENFSGATASSTGSITFEGSDDALMLNSNALNGSDFFVPTLSGFNASDVIDYEGTVTNAIYNSGVLTLFDGATAVAYLTIGSGYDGDTFTTTPLSGGVTQIVDPVATTATIADGATLDVNEPSSDIISFAGTTGTLILEQPASFQGQIAGPLASGDVIDLKGFDAAHTAVAMNFNAISDTTMVTVTDAPDHQAVTLTLDGNDSNLIFNVANDGKGGVDLAPVMAQDGGSADLVATHQSLTSIDADAPIEITGGSTAHIDGSSSQAVNFGAPTGALVLDNPESFTGTISGFTGTAPDAAHSDTIDLVGINYNSSQFAETYNASKGVLTVADGSDTAQLNFTGFNGTFDFASDGNGGTLITDPPGAPSTPGASSGSTTADGSTGTGGNGSSPSVHDSLAKIFDALTSDHGGAPPPAPTLTPFGGSGNDSFAFNANLSGQGQHTAGTSSDSGHANTPAGPSSFAPATPELHPNFAFDPAQHVAIETPTAMDQFHQTVAGATLLHS